jgi:aryl-alcohol dehydrogenase-like predicted oxidoreductase
MQAAAGLAVGAAPLTRRALGKTGLQVSILGLGGAPIGNLPDQAAAVDVVKACYDAGVNYFDTASAGAYGLSQTRYGVALGGVRDKVVLSTKTRHRTWTQAELDLTQSLTNMKTDYIDLYQIHNVINEEDIEFIFARRGVMEMVEKARKDGKIRFVGVTGHTDPAILNKIITRYSFDTILMPLSVTDGANKPKSFEAQTLPLAKKLGMGVIAMKTLGAGAVLKAKAATVQESLSYVWTLPVSTAILGCSEVPHVQGNAAIARSFRPLTADGMDRLRRRMEALPLYAMEPWKRIPNGDEPAAVYRAD